MILDTSATSVKNRVCEACKTLWCFACNPSSATSVQFVISALDGLKYGKLPTKNVIRKPWEALCVDLIGPYTLKGRDGTNMDFMCLTIIDLASSWFKMVELLVTDVVETDSINQFT